MGMGGLLWRDWNGCGKRDKVVAFYSLAAPQQVQVQGDRVYSWPWTFKLFDFSPAGDQQRKHVRADPIATRFSALGPVQVQSVSLKFPWIKARVPY